MKSDIWLGAVRRRGMMMVALLAIFALVFTAACGGDDDDDDGDSADSSPIATVTTGPSGDASPTAEEAQEDATNTVAATATEEEEEEASPTATEEQEASPTATEADVDPTATESDTADATATGDGTATTDDPLAELETIDPEELPNFTMSFTFDVTGVPGQEDTSIAAEAEQSSVDNYHMFIAMADAVIETWLVDGTSYIDSGDGTIIPVPAGTDTALFSPAIFLQQVPPIDSELNAERVGEEEVSGRNTVHYRIDGEDYLNQSDLLTGGVATDIQGQVDVWIDTELNIMIRQQGDITWQNEDGTTGVFLSDFLFSDIGTTPAVVAPV